MKTITDWGEWFVDQSWPYEFEIGLDRGMFDHVHRKEALDCGVRYKSKKRDYDGQRLPGMFAPSDWVKMDLIKEIEKADKETILKIEEYTHNTWLYVDPDINSAMLDKIYCIAHEEELQSQYNSGKEI
jgi:hypothetical protein